MSRSPLAYPLRRGTDVDGGGAAELQTDIMRFMAILSLCLVAIFALVQSIPLTPPVAPTQPQQIPPPQQISAAQTTEAIEATAPDAVPSPRPTAAAERAIVLTRPEWKPKYGSGITQPAPVSDESSKTSIPEPESPATVETSAAQGFTLRFESDAALLRAVAAGKVGFYAIVDGRARRMAVSDSRISFWDASTPNLFHEMEGSTVPVAVAEALGPTSDAARWGVTMPGRMTTELKTLMASTAGGILVIAADGRIRLESQ